MKKLLLFIAAIAVLSCSKSDDDQNYNVPATTIYGTWNLISMENYGSTTNVASDCQLEHGKFNFKSDNSVDESIGYVTNDICYTGTYDRDSFTFANNVVEIKDDGFTFKYKASISSNILLLTKFYTKSPSGNITSINESEQVVLKFVK